MSLESLNYNGEKYIDQIREILADNVKDSIGSEMLNEFESKEWKLGRQELCYIEKNPDMIYPYLQYRFKFWKSINKPDLENVSSFPFYLGIEPTSICNIKCRMCWQQDDAVKRKPYSGKMNFSTFKKIVDEACKNECHAITLAGRGEPLINPEICDFLDYAANKFFELKINTNGILLTEKIVHAILKANVSLVVFSAEGTTQQEYEKTRCGGDFSKLIENIKQFNEIRHKYYPQNRTQTRVSGVIIDQLMDKDRYYEFWNSLVDEVVLVGLEDRWDTYNNEVNLANVQPCNRLWHQMYIWWDGSCAVCDNDYLSRIPIGQIDDNTTIQDIWGGEKYNELRKYHRNRQRNTCFPCDRCGL